MIQHMDTSNMALSEIPQEFEYPDSIFDPMVNVLVCTSKIFLLKELNKDRLELDYVYNNPNVSKLSIERHVDELIEDGLAYKSDGFLIITDEGAKVARDIDK